VEALIIGVITGLVYGIVALGLVIVYKGSRVINFAHAQIATLATFACWAFLTDPDPKVPGLFVPHGLPWPVAALIGVAVGAGTGIIIEATVIRRLFHAPRLIVLVATIGVGQLVALVTYLIWLRDERAGGSRIFPSPLQTSFRVGNLVVTGPFIAAAIVVPLVGLGLAAFFKLTRLGIAIRAASDNSDAARLLGVSVRRVSMITWGLGAALAAVAGILIAPIYNGLSVDLLTTGLLIRALAAALLGGLTSLPGALVGGLVVGVGESLLVHYTRIGGVVEAVLFGIILVVLLVRPGGLFGTAEVDAGRDAFVPSVRSLPAWIRRRAVVGVPRLVFGYAVLALGLLLPLALKPSGNFTYSLMLLYAVLGISLNILMGLSGQISLGHFAFLGVGAFMGAKLVTDVHMSYGLAFLIAGVAGGAVAFLIGLPALRIRGLHLAVATLAFAVACQAYLFRQNYFGSRRGISFPRPKVFGFDLDNPSGREFAYATFALFALALFMAANIQRRRSGRALLAVRENETSAAVLGVSVRGYKLLAFTISGIVAAWAGVFYGMLISPVQFETFPALKSIDIVAMVIIGGLGSLPGAVLGAIYVVGIPRMFPDSAIAPLLSTGFGLLLVLMIRPGGLWKLLTGLRDGYVWSLTVEDRAFKGPLSHLVPTDVPEAARLESLFAPDADAVEEPVGPAAD